MSKTPLKINLDSLKERKGWKRHEVNQGDNVYRVLPPFGESSDGYAYRRWVVAWLTDPQSGRRRPYASPRSFGEDACPVTEYIARLEKKREAIETELKAQGLSKEEIRDQLKPISDVIWTTKPKATYVYNACNKAGEVGLLELKKTAHDAMKKQMMQYVTDYGQDPTSLLSEDDDSGVWFKIRREGEGTSTEYSVSKSQAKEKTAKGISYIDDRDPLPQNVVDNYDNLGYDLTTLYKRMSYEELKDVLMANLSVIYQQNPDAAVDGFLVEEDELPAPTPIKKAQAPAAKKITTRFDDADDEDTTPWEDKKLVAQAKKPTAPASKARASSDDDIFSYAESLLDN